MNDIYNRKDEEFTVIGEVPESLKLNDPLYKEGFQAGAASRDAEVAEHIEEITALKEVIKHGDAQRERDMELAGEERDQLRAQINVLREALSKTLARRLCYEIAGQTDEEVDRQTGAIGNNWR